MTFRRKPDRRRIYDAIDANDFDLALRIVTADPLAVESPDVIPPPLECCGDADKPEWVEWLLDHGADIERLNQDYGSTPLTCAVIRRQKRIIRTLVKRGADATRAMDHAQRGLAGDFEDESVYDPAKQATPLIAKDIGKSSSYFESLASMIDGGSRQ